MLRNVVVHLLNEQPIMADLVAAPKQVDVSVICCNLRTMGGMQPVFVDRSDSTFVIPLTHIRFMEISAASLEAHAADDRAEVAGPGSAIRLARPTGVASGDGETGSGAGTAAEGHPKSESDEIDPDLLRRVRDA